MSNPDDLPPRPVRHYLKEWREKRGLFQEQLAEMVDSSGSALSRFETGERYIKFDMQLKLMQALGITAAQFFTHPDDTDLEALITRLKPEDRARVAKIVKTFVDDDS
jgi:transcriptional regulator with XRE-family HTH domain